MELSDAVRQRHMTRNFLPDPLGREVVDHLCNLALRAPSAGNTQGCELVVLEGPAQTARYWEATTDEPWRASSRRYGGLSRAPVVILPFADPAAYRDRYAELDKVRPDGGEVAWVVPYWHVDAAFAAMTLLLAAADGGLGAAFLGNFRGEERLRRSLGVPSRMRWLGAVLLGLPAQPDPPSSSALRLRRPASERVHRGGWSDRTLAGGTGEAPSSSSGSPGDDQAGASAST